MRIKGEQKLILWNGGPFLITIPGNIKLNFAGNSIYTHKLPFFHLKIPPTLSAVK